MHKILQDNLDVFCTVYLDDILIVSYSASVYEQYLFWVLQ